METHSQILSSCHLLLNQLESLHVPARGRWVGSMTIECIFDIFEDSDKLQVQVQLKNENIIVSLKSGQERKRVITIVPRKECVK